MSISDSPSATPKRQVGSTDRPTHDTGNPNESCEWGEDFFTRVPKEVREVFRPTEEDVITPRIHDFDGLMQENHDRYDDGHPFTPISSKGNAPPSSDELDTPKIDDVASMLNDHGLTLDFFTLPPSSSIDPFRSTPEQLKMPGVVIEEWDDSEPWSQKDL